MEGYGTVWSLRLRVQEAGGYGSDTCYMVHVSSRSRMIYLQRPSRRYCSLYASILLPKRGWLLITRNWYIIFALLPNEGKRLVTKRYLKGTHRPSQLHIHQLRPVPNHKLAYTPNTLIHTLHALPCSCHPFSRIACSR